MREYRRKFELLCILLISTSEVALGLEKREIVRPRRGVPAASPVEEAEDGRSTRPDGETSSSQKGQAPLDTRDSFIRWQGPFAREEEEWDVIRQRKNGYGIEEYNAGRRYPKRGQRIDGGSVREGGNERERHAEAREGNRKQRRSLHNVGMDENVEGNREDASDAMEENKTFQVLQFV